jgi:hypothetical protein
LSEWKQEERFKGLSYSQNISTKAMPLDEDTIRTEVVLDDPDHHIEVYLITSVSKREILDAGAVIKRQPYPMCHLGMEKVKRVIGMKIKKGLYEKMGERVAGREGCVHLFELLMTAARLTSNAILGVTVGGKTWENITERDDEFHARLMERLEGMCIGFNKDVLDKHKGN